jgi:putative Holliday junction resolvase
MIFNDLKKFKEQIKWNTRVIGVDFGSKNIGISISDKDLNIANPKTTIARKTNRYVIQNIKQIIIENNVSAIVFGLPLNTNGEETAFCKSIRNFVLDMEKYIDAPIYFYNEAFTSNNAESIIIDELGWSFKRAKNNVDKVAATLLLRDFLQLLQQCKLP